MDFILRSSNRSTLERKPKSSFRNVTTRKADYVDHCDSNKNENNQALEDSENCDTTQHYVLVDKYTIREEIENAVKSNSAQIESLWKYFDILIDIISDDGKRIKRSEEKRPKPSGRPTLSRTLLLYH